MKHIPILFSTPMVQAILNGTKKQTRRVIKPQPDEDGLAYHTKIKGWFDTSGKQYKPKASIGDIFWVRETFEDYMGAYNYKAGKYGLLGEKWKPSIFMPKDACRIFLAITNIRAERIKDISEEDAKLEGAFDMNCGIHGITDHKNGFFDLWESINGKESLNENPYVFAYDFERTDKPKNL